MLDNEKIRTIIDRNTYLWERRLTKNNLNLWLDNFRGESIQHDQEKDLALDLLSKFIFYTEREIRYLCRAAFSILKQNRIKENPSLYVGSKSTQNMNAFIRKCKFSYIGRAGESGSMILYYFRQENNLPASILTDPRSFQKPLKSQNKSSWNFVFVDDFLGTGKTGCDFWDLNIRPFLHHNPDANWYYLALVGSKRGVDKLKERTGFRVFCPQILDDGYRVFNENSSIFPDVAKRQIAQKVFKHYGDQLVPKAHALGFRDTQSLLGFNHNIPDNTLPIIWAEKQICPDRKWYPIFRRKEKI